MSHKNLANSWKQFGQISIWRYTENERNYPGWHMSADDAGCESLLALLDAFRADGSGSRVFSISSPTKAQLGVPNNKGGLAKWVAPAKLRLTFSAHPEEWSFPPEVDPASLTIGSAWLAELSDGIAGILKGLGDYSIGDPKGGLALWFWW